MSDFFDHVKIGWRAISDVPVGKELQSISVISDYTVKVRAGRLAKGHFEILLFRFELTHFPTNASLPSGNGFEVKVYNISDQNFIGISRTDDGPLDLYESMLIDVLSYTLRAEPLPHKILFRRFIDRLSAWQAFMGRGKKGLSRKDEVGLIGELIFLRKLLDLSLPSTEILSWWKGPLHGIHDYQISGSAIEIKTSIAEQNFEIDVFDLEQLEPAGVQSLYLGAIRLKADPKGESLPELIESLKMCLSSTPKALSLFEIALGYAGYDAIHASHYSTRFTVEEVLYFNIDHNFPSLRRENIPREVCKVKYKLDLDLLDKPNRTLENVLKQFGVVTHGIE